MAALTYHVFVLAVLSKLVAVVVTLQPPLWVLVDSKIGSFVDFSFFMYFDTTSSMHRPGAFVMVR